MPTILDASATLINDRMKYSCKAGNHPPVITDYTPPLGDGEAPTSLQLLLMSLASCSSGAIVPMLRKMKKTVTGFEAKAVGTRRDEHPTAFTDIKLHFTLTSPDVAPAELERVIKLAEETYCPVWAMLKGSVKITTEYEIRN